MVYNPRRYRFTGFLKAGIRLDLIEWNWAVIFIHKFGLY